VPPVASVEVIGAALRLRIVVPHSPRVVPRRGQHCWRQNVCPPTSTWLCSTSQRNDSRSASKEV
jgi:hypothetical protein